MNAAAEDAREDALHILQLRADIKGPFDLFGSQLCRDVQQSGSS